MRWVAISPQPCTRWWKQCWCHHPPSGAGATAHSHNSQECRQVCGNAALPEAEATAQLWSNGSVHRGLSSQECYWLSGLCAPPPLAQTLLVQDSKPAKNIGYGGENVGLKMKSIRKKISVYKETRIWKKMLIGSGRNFQVMLSVIETRLEIFWEGNYTTETEYQ